LVFSLVVSADGLCELGVLCGEIRFRSFPGLDPQRAAGASSTPVHPELRGAPPLLHPLPFVEVP
jgi:hypothetical protein